MNALAVTPGLRIKTNATLGKTYDLNAKQSLLNARKPNIIGTVSTQINIKGGVAWTVDQQDGSTAIYRCTEFEPYPTR